MSEREEREEQERASKGFRVVDRRRFTEEGEARDDSPEDSEPVKASEPAPAPEAQPEPAPLAPLNEPESETEEIPEPSGRIDFISFVASLATNSMAALGALPEAQAQGIPRNPDLAREYIDIISMLHYKTRGNLSPQEAAAMQRITSDLKMAYVQMTGDFKGGQ
ncbi:MAG: DUF1844 domain-containing protein [Myxococcota bacterium]